MEYGFRLMQPNWMEFRNTFALYREKYAREFSVSRKNDRRDDGGSRVVVVFFFLKGFRSAPSLFPLIRAHFKLLLGFDTSRLFRTFFLPYLERRSLYTFLRSWTDARLLTRVANMALRRVKKER